MRSSSCVSITCAISDSGTDSPFGSRIGSAPSAATLARRPEVRLVYSCPAMRSRPAGESTLPRSIACTIASTDSPSPARRRWSGSTCTSRTRPPPTSTAATPGRLRKYLANTSSVQLRSSVMPRRPELTTNSITGICDGSRLKMIGGSMVVGRKRFARSRRVLASRSATSMSLP